MDRLKVLLLEDSPVDAELIVDHLSESGFAVDPRREETRDGFMDGLSWEPDVILADYRLPGFDGLEALKILRDRRSSVPLILVSGAIGEELAIEAIRLGATDYLLKDRLARLGTAVVNALAISRLERQRELVIDSLRAAEDRYLSLIDELPAIVYTQSTTDPSVFISASGTVESILDIPRAHLIGEPGAWEGLLDPRDKERIVAARREAKSWSGYALEYRFRTPGGRIVLVRDRGRLVRLEDADGMLAFRGVMFDVSPIVSGEDHVAEEVPA